MVQKKNLAPGAEFNNTAPPPHLSKKIFYASSFPPPCLSNFYKQKKKTDFTVKMAP